jgi:hypothetical protein
MYIMTYWTKADHIKGYSKHVNYSVVRAYARSDASSPDAFRVEVGLDLSNHNKVAIGGMELNLTIDEARTLGQALIDAARLASGSLVV